MIAFLLVVLSVSLLANAVGTYMITRLSRRLFDFDDLFELLVHDIQVNLDHFDKMKTSALLENSPEVFEAHKNMQIMAIRLEEYVIRMEELTNRQLKKRPKNLGPPPKVV